MERFWRGWSGRRRKEGLATVAQRTEGKERGRHCSWDQRGIPLCASRRVHRKERGERASACSARNDESGSIREWVGKNAAWREEILSEGEKVLEELFAGF